MLFFVSRSEPASP